MLAMHCKRYQYFQRIINTSNSALEMAEWSNFYSDHWIPRLILRHFLSTYKRSLLGPDSTLQRFIMQSLWCLPNPRHNCFRGIWNRIKDIFLPPSRNKGPTSIDPGFKRGILSCFGLQYSENQCFNCSLEQARLELRQFVERLLHCLANDLKLYPNPNEPKDHGMEASI